MYLRQHTGIWYNSLINHTMCSPVQFKIYSIVTSMIHIAIWRYIWMVFIIFFHTRFYDFFFISVIKKPCVFFFKSYFHFYYNKPCIFFIWPLNGAEINLRPNRFLWMSVVRSKMRDNWFFITQTLNRIHMNMRWSWFVIYVVPKYGNSH